jgi:hypothetical protein
MRGRYFKKRLSPAELEALTSCGVVFDGAQVRA